MICIKYVPDFIFHKICSYMIEFNGKQIFQRVLGKKTNIDLVGFYGLKYPEIINRMKIDTNPIRIDQGCYANILDPIDMRLKGIVYQDAQHEWLICATTMTEWYNRIRVREYSHPGISQIKRILLNKKTYEIYVSFDLYHSIEQAYESIIYKNILDRMGKI